ncbi:hypothetical protein [Celeribacter marinus]|uniref:Uncharacterized protein n=1 Tax=Celeribacter marinus TaxID=1397108 RepID=A0A0N9ZEJ5_9RHOB|nr:hypothetical protein [Celeribacter marinus]ALI54771.1 hypothetical protein IMCC12053_823 [Celeribacter marinus]SFK56035.1 PEP-CTERM protein-sorting domain-containing protein [Celeribacter marinus]
MDQINGSLLFKILMSFLALGGVGYVFSRAPKWLWIVGAVVIVAAITVGFFTGVLQTEARRVAVFYLIVSLPVALPALGIGVLFGMAKRRREADYG